jgi:hypothetical protein
MIRVITLDGREFEIADADAWEVQGGGIVIISGGKIIAQFSQYLVVERL